MDDASLGVFITGATGAGKSTGPFDYILRSYLRAGFGGLFLCAKIDAVTDYLKLASSEGRKKDVIIFRPGIRGLGFNFLTYEAKHHGPGKTIIENLVLALMQAVEIAARHSGGHGDAFFDNAMKQLLRHCLSVSIPAVGKVDLRIVQEIVQSLPQNLGDADRIDQLRSMQILAQAERNASPDLQNELRMARQYFTWEWPTLADRTRSSIAISLSVLLDSFLRFPLREMFLGELSVSPDDCLTGKLVIVDISVKEYDLIGKISGTLWKYSLQKAIERRPELAHGHAPETIRPTFLSADECQFWATSHDALFQMTARSARGLTVYATQSISNLYAEVGGDGTQRARVDSLLGNLQTRIACQNLDQTTNNWHADAIGKIIVSRKSSSDSRSYGPDQYSFLSRLAGTNRTIGNSESEQLDYDCQPRAFTGLRRGGAQGKIEGILVSAGRRFSASGKRWMLISFDQFKPRRSAPFFDANASVVITAPDLRS